MQQRYALGARFHQARLARLSWELDHDNDGVAYESLP